MSKKISPVFIEVAWDELVSTIMSSKMPQSVKACKSCHGCSGCSGYTPQGEESSANLCDLQNHDV